MGHPLKKVYMEYDVNKCQGSIFKGYTGCCCSYCAEFAAIKNKWLLCLKPWNSGHYEIAIARKNNRHAFTSWGWYGVNKIHISDASSHHHADKQVYQQLVRLAEELACQKNLEENL
jgi:hypothetical protein